MPGPGGGGRGGGGHGGGGFHGGGGHGGGGSHGGGFHGGGFHGGGFHGGPPPFHGPHMGFRGWGHRGGGCLGGLFSMIFIPIIIGVLLVVFLIGSLTGRVTWDNYDEETFQDYANVKYFEYFGEEADTEDQLLILFLTYEDRNQYSYLAWIGDDIDSRINGLFGNDYTELGSLLADNVAENYKYSLGNNLAQVIDSLSDEVEDLGLESSFREGCNGDHSRASGRLINHSGLSFSSATLESALDGFAAETGISVVLLVEENTTVFGTNHTPQTIAIVFLAIFLIGIVLLIRRRKKKVSGSENNPNDL